MPTPTPAFQKTKISKMVFMLSILAGIFWYIAWTVDVYHFSVAGAVFEILWLPMLALLLVLPLISLYFLVRDRFNKNSLYLLSLLILSLSILVAYVQNTF